MAGKKYAGSFTGWPKPHFAYAVKTNKHYRQHYQGALMYAHYELSSIDLKKEVVKYLKHIDPKHPMLDRIKDIHENRFATVGKYMYILNHGGDLPDNVTPTLMPAFEKIVHEEERKIATAAKEEEFLAEKNGSNKQIEDTPKMVITIQDRLREKAREVAGEVEGWLDDFHTDRKSPIKTVEDFVNLFRTYELKAPHMRYMQMSFERRAAEITEAVGGKNKDLNEGYSCYTKPELKKLEHLYQNLLKACNMLQEVAKVERAPRKKKPVSQDKIVSKLKFKKDDNTLGIVSLNPVQILGAKEVWVYNTKTRKLAQYKAFDERGLSVKGAGLIDYSSDSVEKTVRKPAETLAEFKKASKVKLRTFMKDLTTVDIPCNGKLNENHIILRIDK
jgi:hypothetical protein